MKWKLIACRLQAGLTQKEVAVALGVKDTTVGSWENGKSSPSMEQGAALSELYRIPMESMDFSRDGNKQRISV